MNLRSLKKISYRIVGSFYGKGVVFLASTYVSKRVGPENFGNLALVLSLYSVFLILGGMQLTPAVATWSAQNPTQRRMLYWHGLGFISVTYVVTLAVFYTFIFLVNPIKDAETLRIACLYTPTLILFLMMELLKCVNLGAGRIGLLTIMEALQGTIKAGVLIGLVYMGGFSGWLPGRVLGEATAFIALFLIMIFVFRRDFAGQSRRFDRSLLKRFGDYYKWTFLSGGLVQIQMQVQPFIVLYLVQDNREVAFIKIALLYLTSFGLLGASITQALYADVAKKHRDRDGLLRHLRKVIVSTSALFALALAGFWFLAPWLINLLHGPEYANVVPLFRIILLAALFQHISYINGGYWLAVGNIKLISLVSLASFIFFMVVAIPMCWRWKTLGMAWAVTISTAFNAALNTWASHRWIVSHTQNEEPHA